MIGQGLMRVLLAAAVLALAAAAEAVNIELVPVANPGNAPDTRYVGSNHGNVVNTAVGAVDYSYAIGKYEITAGQYCAFLSAVAGNDPYELYTTRADYDANPGDFGCNIRRSGSSGSYTYSVASDWADRPANWVSWGSAVRFCNWLANGQPTGTLTGNPAQDAGLTENGSYQMGGATTVSALLAITRKPAATWVLPTQDEWYKAAYYDPNKPGGAGYWDYPTKSDTAPSNTLVSPDPGNHASYRNFSIPGEGSYTIGGPYYRTPVGAFENSQSAYGTYDQGGNVWEWHESIVQHDTWGPWRGDRGGSFGGQVDQLGASASYASNAQYGWYSLGFRVASLAVALPGDANGDGVVDIIDLNRLLTNYNKSGMDWSQGDFDGNGAVDISDLNKLLTNYNKSGASGVAAVPEPAGLVLLGIGAASVLVCLRRPRTRKSRSGCFTIRRS